MKRINEFGLNVGTADERMKLSDRHKAVWKMAVSGTRQDRHDLNVGSHSGTGSPERFLFPKIWLFSKYSFHCFLSTSQATHYLFVAFIPIQCANRYIGRLVPEIAV